MALSHIRKEVFLKSISKAIVVNYAIYPNRYNANLEACRAVLIINLETLF